MINIDYDDVKVTNGVKYLVCPFCGKHTVALHADSYWGTCGRCHCTVITYKPTELFVKAHSSNARVKLFLGGFGSGKTTGACGEVADHAFSVPNGKTLITGPKLQQINDAVIPELEKFIPPMLIASRTTKPNYSLKLTNGHEFVVYSSKDEEELRSLNLTAFYIEEASGVDESIYTQLLTRLRNLAAIVTDEKGRKHEKYLGIVCSNPEDAWFVPTLLYVSNKIYASKSVDIGFYRENREPAKNRIHFIESYLSSTRDNQFLPASFIDSLIRGKSQAWVDKYIDCKLSICENMVYPKYKSVVIEPFMIPDSWQRVFGFDKGFADETALICGAIDPTTGIIYYYDEYYVTEKTITYHAKHIAPMVKPFKLFRPIQADPTVRNRNELTGTSYQQHFLALSDIFLDEGNNKIDYGVSKVNEFIETKRLFIFNTCTNLLSEMSHYQRDPRNGKPKDGKIHLCDSIRYSIMPIPVIKEDVVAEIATFEETKRLGKHADKREIFAGDSIYDEYDDFDISEGGVYLSGR